MKEYKRLLRKEHEHAFFTEDIAGKGAGSGAAGSTYPRESEEGKDALRRWAVVGDEIQRLMIQAEEQLSLAQLARLKAEINGIEVGARDLWAKYREGDWRLPKLGAPGPGDEPPPIVPIRDLF